MKIRSHIGWKQAFQQELEVVAARRGPDDPVDSDLTGLAFSGGGIRSATFGLGVLEALKKLGLLTKVDYLSTVSGGGYIGAWFSANCKRSATHDWRHPDTSWDESVRHLRRYSNYLSPVVGFFSADTWSVAMVWIRNALLVQITVILAIAVALLLPRPLYALFAYWPSNEDLRWITIALFILGSVGIAANLLRVNRTGDLPFLKGDRWLWSLAGSLASLGAAWGITFVRHFEPFAPGPVDPTSAVPVAFLLVLAGYLSLPAGLQLVNRVAPRARSARQINYNQTWTQFLVVVPMMVAGLLVAAILWGQSKPGSGKLADTGSFGAFFTTAWEYWPFPLSVVFASLWLLSWCCIRGRMRPLSIVAAAAAPIPAVITLHALLCAIMLLLHHWASLGSEGEWLAFIWAPAMVLYSFSLTIVMLIGMLGRQSREGGREWWSRLGAWLGIYGFAWMVVTLAAAYGPLATAFLLSGDWKSNMTSGGWVVTSLAGIFAGKSEKTGGKSDKPSLSAKATEVLAAVAPFIFIAGLLVGVSAVLNFVVAVNTTYNPPTADTWDQLTGAAPAVVWGLIAGCTAVLLLMAWRVDINEFSLNAFYRNRLVRCYLGATRQPDDPRKPQNFTGFDDQDDLPLAQLIDPHAAPAGPLHIINCALNLGGSSDLLLHTRHSTNFTMTPLYCGSPYLIRDQAGTLGEMGFAPTSTFGGADGQPTLGQAISVSGAAASPNMGYHTSTATAFLITLFNARLGWWFPHPGGPGIDSPSPMFSLRYLIRELFGGANEKSEYLAVSDGGHFENLAAYELIRRRCRLIVISDAECDIKMQFGGLGTLIRMCEVDFGAKITIDVSALRPAPGSSWSASRHAVGAIEYDDGSAGTLVYLKASLTGNEGTDILQYKSAHPAFPHESTGDQFYGEDQFESYRALGREIATNAFSLKPEARRDSAPSESPLSSAAAGAT